MTEKLYAKATKYADVKGSECGTDIYCGIGTIFVVCGKKPIRL